MHRNSARARAITQSTDALKALVDVDTALIGFLAIIAVFVLTTNNNSIQSLNEEKRRIRLDYDTLSSIVSNPQKNIPPQTQKSFFEMKEKEIKEKNEALDLRKKKLRDKANSSIRWLLGSVVAFVTSIFLTLLAIGQYGTDIGVYGPFVYFSIYSCILGILSIFYQIALLQEE